MVGIVLAGREGVAGEGVGGGVWGGEGLTLMAAVAVEGMGLMQQLQMLLLRG